MIGNRYGRAMSSRANVVGPEIIDDIDAGAIGHQSAIPKLAGISLPAVVWRLVQHRLAVVADHPHGVPRDAVLIEKTHHSIGLRQCQHLFRLCEYPGLGSVEAPCESSIECLRYQLLKSVGIRREKPGAKFRNVAPIGSKRRTVDEAVNDSPGHQSDCPVASVHTINSDRKNVG